MTTLSRLKVSLTKHGAHKIAILFEQYDSTEILKHLWRTDPGINIELAQAKKNLSASRSGLVPALWDEARSRGSETVRALVLIGIIFSHDKLIRAMRSSTDPAVRYAGTIYEGKQLSGKAFTNFAHTLEELGYTTEHSAAHVRYDLARLFKIPQLNVLAIKLLALKLQTAGWSQNNSVIEELLLHDFHQVFSIDADEFREWLTTGFVEGADLGGDDLAFFADANDTPSKGGFVFKSGHNKRKTGKVGVAASKSTKTADLIHNAMQNDLYDMLVGLHGKNCVGTEISTGADTSIDLVVKTSDFCWFYEIKTADTVKACIRQALPQLLEYAYWREVKGGVDRLVIIGPAKLTSEAKRYLKLLNEKFGIPLAYEQWVKPTV